MLLITSPVIVSAQSAAINSSNNVSTKSLKDMLGADSNTASLEQGISIFEQCLSNPDSIHSTERDFGRHVRAESAVFVGLLFERKRYDDVTRLSLAAIETSASDSKNIELLQQFRVKALLAREKNVEALQAAKSLYNVASMSGTSDAITLAASAIRAANPSDRSAVETLKAEQTAGAVVPSSNTPSSTPLRSATLDAIKVDPKLYESFLARYTGEAYSDYVARGNLYLLMDKTKEARSEFEQAYRISTDKQLAEATENLARVIKAEDGTIGRANAFVISLRPKPKTDPAQLTTAPSK